MFSRAKSDPVGRDVQNVVTEAQELLKTVNDEGATRVDAARGRMQAKYAAARDKLGELQATVTDNARTAATTTDHYVRGNPWTAVGVAAAVGVLIGLALTSRR